MRIDKSDGERYQRLIGVLRSIGDIGLIGERLGEKPIDPLPVLDHVRNLQIPRLARFVVSPIVAAWVQTDDQWVPRWAVNRPGSTARAFVADLIHLSRTLDLARLSERVRVLKSSEDWLLLNLLTDLERVAGLAEQERYPFVQRVVRPGRPVSWGSLEPSLGIVLAGIVAEAIGTIDGAVRLDWGMVLEDRIQQELGDRLVDMEPDWFRDFAREGARRLRELEGQYPRSR